MTAEPRKPLFRRRARRSVAAVAFALATIAVLASVQSACVKTGASLGQACLSNEDCFSGQCAGQLCVSAAPTLDAEAEGDGEAPGSDGAVDALPPDAADAPAVPDAASDSTSPDANGEGGDGAAPADGSHDASLEAADASADETGPDGSPDAAGTTEGGLDAPTDVQLDVAGG